MHGEPRQAAPLPNFSRPIGWGFGNAAHPRTHAASLQEGWSGQMFSVCPIIKWAWGSDLAFIFYEWERETCSLCGIQNQPASLTNWKSQCQFVLCDSSRILTGECTDKRVSLCEEIANCCCCFSFMRMTNCGATKRSRIIVNAQMFPEITQKIYWNIQNNVRLNTEKHFRQKTFE